MRGAEAVHGAALEVTLIGTAQDNAFWAHGREVVVKGKGGADTIVLSSERMDQAPFDRHRLPEGVPPARPRERWSTTTSRRLAGTTS